MVFPDNSMGTEDSSVNTKVTVTLVTTRTNPNPTTFWVHFNVSHEVAQLFFSERHDVLLSLC